MAYTTIDDPTIYFNTVLYTGDGTSSKAVTGVGFQPDWVWLKARSATYSHQLFDVARGATQLLTSEATDAEQTLSGVTSFDSDGFTVGSDAGSNNNTTTFVSWNWLAGGSASSNTDGSITSSVSANTTAGFSIVSYTGNGVSGATIGHGLGSKPRWIVAKMRDSANNWLVQHGSLGATKRLLLDTTLAESTQPFWGNTEPTSDVFSVGSVDLVNQSGNTYIAYCFAEKKGYSKFGSYTGNGNADGPFIYTGFKPAWVMIKPSSYANSWLLLDNKRPGFNVTNDRLEADGNGAENDSIDHADFLSNGFKIRTSNAHPNNSGGTLIYAAFAESPFVSSSGIPTTAR
tara:strand:+ start:1502 stop:2533 length:1032 start_codon:yes stop_codon:yes gene_type:complete